MRGKFDNARPAERCSTISLVSALDSRAGPVGWVLYDQGCGVCARWVPFWAPTLRRLGLEIAPLQAPWVVERLDVAPDALLRDVRLLFADGRQLAGADLFFKAGLGHNHRPGIARGRARGARLGRGSRPGAFAQQVSHVLLHLAATCIVCGMFGVWLAPLALTALTAAWRDLVMLSYEVEPAVVTPLVPAGTTLDLWQGRALVSVVGFRFLGTRVLGVSVPWHRDFDEVNLRLYVRRELEGGEVRRGVVFVREVVARRAITWLARVAYNEPYRTLPIVYGPVTWASSAVVAVACEVSRMKGNCPSSESVTLTPVSVVLPVLATVIV